MGDGTNIKRAGRKTLNSREKSEGTSTEPRVNMVVSSWHNLSVFVRTLVRSLQKSSVPMFGTNALVLSTTLRAQVKTAVSTGAAGAGKAATSPRKRQYQPRAWPSGCALLELVACWTSASCSVTSCFLGTPNAIVPPSKLVQISEVVTGLPVPAPFCSPVQVCETKRTEEKVNQNEREREIELVLCLNDPNSVRGTFAQLARS